jgi:hypothetical protein
MQPRARAVKGTMQLKFGGGPWKSIAEHVQEASLPPKVLQVLSNIQTKVENPLLSLFPVEGRLATFEQARALAEAKRMVDTGSGHFAPATKKFKAPAERRKTPITTEERYIRDVGGSMQEPSKIEKLTDPKISKYVTSGSRIIEGSSTTRPQASVRSIKKLFEQIEKDVQSNRISKDVGDAIRNRVIESLMQSGAGEALLPALARSSGTGGKLMAQTRTGELVRKAKPITGPDASARVLDAIDKAAEREGLALRGKSQDTRLLPGPADIDPRRNPNMQSALMTLRGRGQTRADRRMNRAQSNALMELFRLFNPRQLNVSPTAPSFGMKGTSSEVGRIATAEELIRASEEMDRRHALSIRPTGTLLRAGLRPRPPVTPSSVVTEEELKAMLSRIKGVKKRNLRVGRNPAPAKD